MECDCGGGVVWCGGEGIQHTRRKLQGLWN